MSSTVLCNVLVFVGIFVGDYLGTRPTGMLIGATVGMVSAALLSERFGPARRSTDGFWLRHRGEFLVNVGAIVGVVVAQQWLSASLGSAAAPIAGFFGGMWLGGYLADQMGWSGTRFTSEFEARGTYVTILGSAALANGRVSEKERAAVLAAAKRVMVDMGYGEACDGEALLAHAEQHPCSPLEAAAYASQMAPQQQQTLLADLLSVLYSDCRGPGAPGPANEQWLDTFRQAAQIANWSLLGIYDRRFTDGQAAGSRAQWLAELELEEGASDEQIRAAYRRKAAEYHPDRHQGLQPQIRSLTEAKLASVTDAYRRLLERGGQGSGVGSGPLFFQDVDSGAGFLASEDQALLCRCWLCGNKNQFPAQAIRVSVRCGGCHALLATHTLPEGAAQATETANA